MWGAVSRKSLLLRYFRFNRVVIGNWSLQNAAVFVSLLFAVWFVGPRNIWPTNRRWTLFGDLRLAELHWDFYRNTSIFQFPIAGTPNYVRIEPHPILFHLPFKLLNGILPESFQFIGLSLVVFFALQTLVALRLLRHFGISEFSVNIGAVFLTITPLLIFRTGQLSHTMLGGHFLILLSIYLYSKGTSRFVTWATPVLIASVLDMYLLVVMITICVASTVKEVTAKSEELVIHIKLQVAILLSLAGSLFVQGYLSNPSMLVAKYSFRLNVAAFVNPHFAPGASFSGVLSRIDFFNRTIASEEVEGFAYLGLGAILLIAIGASLSFHRNSKSDHLKWAPIGVVAVFWTYVAFSPNLVIFRREFRIFELPGISTITETFRGAPRFAVLLYYLLIIFGIVQVSRLPRKSLAIGLLAFFAFVQALDISPGVLRAHKTISSPKEVGVILDGHQWSALSDYRHLKLYPVYDFHSDFNGKLSNHWIDGDRWYPLVSFASRSRMTSNFGYLSRENLSYTRAENAATLRDLRSGRLAPCTIYSVSSQELWSTLSDGLTADQVSVSIDGYYLILPDRSTCQ